jgi:hypothetical protein
MRTSSSSTVKASSVGRTRRYLAVSLASFVGMLAWAGGAFAADTLTLCVNPGGNVTSAAEPSRVSRRLFDWFPLCIKRAVS